MNETFTPRAGDALIVVDMQYDFMPGGTLPVAEGDAIVPLVNRLASRFATVVLTQDWHPPGHASFTSAHPGAKPFETIRLGYGDQVLWPDHCVQKSRGAELHHGLDIGHALLVLRKGANREVDSYSAFIEADGVSRTGLAGFLQRTRRIDRIFFCGSRHGLLRRLFCARCTDRRLRGLRGRGYQPLLIDLAGSLAAAWAKMNEGGVAKIDANQIAG